MKDGRSVLGRATVLVKLVRTSESCDSILTQQRGDRTMSYKLVWKQVRRYRERPRFVEDVTYIRREMYVPEVVLRNLLAKKKTCAC